MTLQKVIIKKLSQQIPRENAETNISILSKSQQPSIWLKLLKIILGGVAETGAILISHMRAAGEFGDLPSLRHD